MESNAHEPTAPSPTSSAQGSDAFVVRELVIACCPGPFGAPRVRLEGRTVTIGRAPDGESILPIPDHEVSRNHAELVYSEASDAWSLRDLGSRNGVRVDGKRVKVAEMKNGSVVRVGRTLLVFVEARMRRGEPLAPETPALLGPSLAMQRLRGEVALAAPRKIPVLVLGASGVGKERVAEEIHRQSGRRGAFISVNCAAIPEALAETELFGHGAGAFTGATHRSDGLFVAADGGTLFLDEVGELPLPIQSKLLRTLATGEVRPVGRAESRRVDVRIVAATLRDVAGQVDASSFRGDLFARLSGWTLRVPALRQRKDDILPFVTVALAREGGATLSLAAAEALIAYDWRYNVRQLEQVIAAAMVRCASSGVIGVEHLPEDVAASSLESEPSSVEPIVVRQELDQGATLSQEDEALRDLLVAKLAEHGGNVSEVARAMGRARMQIHRWMRRFRIDPASFRPA